MVALNQRRLPIASSSWLTFQWVLRVVMFQLTRLIIQVFRLGSIARLPLQAIGRYRLAAVSSASAGLINLARYNKRDFRFSSGNNS